MLHLLHPPLRRPRRHPRRPRRRPRRPDRRRCHRLRRHAGPPKPRPPHAPLRLLFLFLFLSQRRRHAAAHRRPAQGQNLFLGARAATLEEGRRVRNQEATEEEEGSGHRRRREWGGREGEAAAGEREVLIGDHVGEGGAGRAAPGKGGGVAAALGEHLRGLLEYQ